MLCCGCPKRGHLLLRCNEDEPVEAAEPGNDHLELSELLANLFVSEMLLAIEMAKNASLGIRLDEEGATNFADLHRLLVTLHITLAGFLQLTTNEHSAGEHERAKYVNEFLFRGLQLLHIRQKGLGFIDFSLLPQLFHLWRHASEEARKLWRAEKGTNGQTEGEYAPVR
jgi:hypothetical protein